MNLLSKLHKNSILTGPVDSYCLVCGCLLHSEEESYAHIHEPSHVDKLRAVPQLADHNDCVIKSNAGYFCRFCNVILPTIKRVSLHVAESKHKGNRISQAIIRQANVILAFETVVINDRAWNGLDGSTCSVCNEDYDDEEAHRSDAAHVLNLIQTFCEFGETYIYRKVDDELFFCLICNEILPILEKTTHHEGEKHLELFEKSKLVNTDLQSQAAIETNNNTLKSPVNDVKTEVVKAAQDIKPKTVNNKVQNGSAHINDVGRIAQDNIQKSAYVNVTENYLNPSKNTEKVKIPEPAKSANDKIRQEPLNTNVLAKDKETNKPASLKKETDKESKPANNDETTIVPTKQESYLYKILKANDFIIRLQDGLACCTICDVKLSELNIGSHTLDTHHKILYSKHIASKNACLDPVNLQSNESKTAKVETKVELKTKEAKIVTDKECTVNQADVKNSESEISVKERKEAASKDTKEEINTVKQKTQAVIEKQDTPKEIKTLDTKVVNEANKVEKQEFTDKENAPPNEKNGNQTQTISISQSKENNKQGAIESNVPSKKGSKKAQKKAAKARAEAEAISKQTTKAGTPDKESNEPRTGEDINNENGVADVASNDLEVTRDTNITNHDEVSQKDIDSKEMASDTEIKTERLSNILKTVSHVDSQDDVVVNGKYVLGNLSFVLVMNSEEVQCVACNERLEVGCVTKHINTEEHKINVEESLVVKSLNDEFIRQVKSQEYHCGYCNILLPNWEELKLHLDTYEHSEAKLSSAWRLHRYQPYLKSSETKEVRSVLTTIFRCTKE